MGSNKEIIRNISRPWTPREKDAMCRRRADRYLNAASSAIAAKVMRQLRVKGLTRIQLAEELGITPANVTRYLSGKCNFELRTLVEMERVLYIRIIDRDIVSIRKEPVKVVIEYKHAYRCSESDICGDDELEIAINESNYMMDYA